MDVVGGLYAGVRTALSLLGRDEPMIVDYSRCKVTFTDGVIPLGRFLYHHDGRAAVWVINKRQQTAQRVLYATGATFVKSSKARSPHLLEIPGEIPWQILQQHGGC